VQDKRRTKAQLIEELRDLRAQVIELERREKELVRAEAATRMFKTISDNARYGVLITDLAGNIVYINGYFAQVHGYVPGELIGRNLSALHNARQLHHVMKLSQELQEGGACDAVEVWHSHRDGSVFPMLMNAVILTDSRGKPVLVANTAIDITTWKRAEEALNDSETRFAVLMDHLPAGVYIKDESSRILYVNQHLKDVFAADMWLHRISVHHFPKAIGDAMMEDDRRVLQRGPLVDEHVVVDRHGVERVYQIYKFPIHRTGCPTLLGGIALDVTDRKRAEGHLQRSLDMLQTAMEEIVEAMTVAGEMRDPYTAGHQRRVAQLACAIAQEVGIPTERIQGLRMAGLIHDIGKMRIPAEILSRPGKLNALEFGLIQCHPQVGYDILRTIEFPWPVAEIILQHHERMDGSGYPQGLRGSEILLEAKILSVADVVESMSSHRPYRPAHGIGRALEEISQYRGTLYDPGVVDACIRVFTERAFKFQDVPAAHV
jgi:PAS domain S-box-containing protein/putative nucleotidyltransferase with HDIG domain